MIIIIELDDKKDEWFRLEEVVRYFDYGKITLVRMHVKDTISKTYFDLTKEKINQLIDGLTKLREVVYGE